MHRITELGYTKVKKFDEENMIEKVIKIYKQTVKENHL